MGGAPIGGLYAPVRDEAAAGTLAVAWDARIRAFDTAPHCGVGVSERRVGEFLAGHPRDEFTVCTKVGLRLVPATGDVQGEEGFYDIPPLTRVRDYSRDGVRRSLEESLGLPASTGWTSCSSTTPTTSWARGGRSVPRAVTAAVVGTRTPQEIAADVSYLPVQIPGELWAELNRVRQR